MFCLRPSRGPVERSSAQRLPPRGPSRVIIPRARTASISQTRRRPQVFPEAPAGLWWPLLVVIPRTGQETEAGSRGARLESGELGFQPCALCLLPRLWDTLLGPLDRVGTDSTGHMACVSRGLQGAALQGSVGPRDQCLPCVSLLSNLVRLLSSNCIYLEKLVSKNNLNRT